MPANEYLLSLPVSPNLSLQFHGYSEIPGITLRFCKISCMLVMSSSILSLYLLYALVLHLDSVKWHLYQYILGQVLSRQLIISCQCKYMFSMSCISLTFKRATLLKYALPSMSGLWANQSSCQSKCNILLASILLQFRFTNYRLFLPRMNGMHMLLKKLPLKIITKIKKPPRF